MTALSVAEESCKKVCKLFNPVLNCGHIFAQICTCRQNALLMSPDVVLNPCCVEQWLAYILIDASSIDIHC